MALGDGIRRNIAHVSPEERVRFRDAILELQNRLYPGSRTDPIPGGVSEWFKQDEIHQATHVHGGPAFLTWHRELCNRFEELMRAVDPDISLHYWDWTQDPRDIPNANLGGGTTGPLNLFTPDFMGYGGSTTASIGEPWLGGGFYVPGAGQHRDSTGNPADPPNNVVRSVAGSPASVASDNGVINAPNFPTMRGLLETVHNAMHGFVNMGSQHVSFRDPFVFLLHSNVDRLFAMWQTVPGQAWRLNPDEVYGSDSGTVGLTGLASPLEPWAGNADNNPIVELARPWAPPENEQKVITSKHPSVVRPPCYDTLPITVDLTTPAIPGAPITFNDVPEGSTAVRAAVFSYTSCLTLHFNVIAGPGAAFNLIQDLPVEIDPDHSLTGEARVWISFHATSIGPISGSSITIRCEETEDEWTIPITGNVIAWPTVASVMVLDKSGSMAWDSGVPNQRRIDILKAAAPIFVEMLPDNDAVGIVSFDHDAYLEKSVKVAGIPVIGDGRLAAKTAINDLGSSGATSIGDGVDLAHQTLLPVFGFDHKAIIVFTDGHENSAKYISEVSGFINERVFAIGLGTAEQLNPVALNALVQGSGGYLMMTDNLGVDDVLRLHKYFLQILAGVVNASVVIDPASTELPGQEHRIKFQLTEADFRSDVILLSPAPWAFDFALETPDGDIIEESDSFSIPGMTFIQGEQVHFYRMTLPLPVGKGARDGTWHALLRVNDGNFKEYMTILRRRQDERALQRAIAHGVPYIINVHARTNVRMHVSVHQTSHMPGSAVVLRTRLTEYDQPLFGSGSVLARIQRPDGTMTTLSLPQIEASVFETTFNAHLPGIYQLLFQGSGETMRGLPFTREELRTAMVWRSGDAPPPTSQDDPRERDEQLCHLLECLLREDTLGRFLAQHNVDPKLVESCVRRFCSRRLQPSSETTISQQEPSISVRDLGDLLSQPGVRDLLARMTEVIRMDQP